MKATAGRGVFAAALVICWLGSTFSAMAAALTGTVTDATGQGMADVMVTARNEATGIDVSVFTAADGTYLIDRLRAGPYQVHAWSRTHTANPQPVTLDQDDAELELTAALDPLAARRLPSSEWLKLLPDGPMKREFIVNCNTCHEIGYDRVTKDGQVRGPDEWMEVMEMMRGMDEYKNIPPDFIDQTYSDWLAEHFNADAIAGISAKPWILTNAVRQSRITEYKLPKDDSLPHDLVVGPDGRIWITAFFYDLIWAMDPDTGEHQTFNTRPEGATDWGQARALKFDGEGALWIILGGTNQLVRLDPATGGLKTIDIGMYAHSLDIDSQGRIWFNDYFNKPERIGFYDPATDIVEHIAVPSANLTEDQGLPLPYGLQIDSKGRLYSTQLTASTLIEYDTATGAAKLFDMPIENAGPRRPSVGTNGEIWIPEWNTGHLTRFIPDGETFTRYKLGSSSLGVYDVETDTQTGEVWATGALDSSMALFNPATESVDTFPLPTEPAYMRHLAVDPETGDLWSAYSSMPAAKPKVVRIERAAR